MAGVKSQNSWQGGELLSGPGFREAGRLAWGGFGKSRKETETRNRPLPRPQAENTTIQKASSAVSKSVAPVFHHPLESAVLSSEGVTNHPPLLPNWSPRVLLVMNRPSQTLDLR